MALRCGCFSVKMYAKIKELGPMGGVRPARPLDPPMAEELLQRGAAPNLREHCSTLAFNNGNNADETYLTLMHDASREGFKEMLKCLLKYGTDVNLSDSKGSTPAHPAATYRQFRIVRYLSQATD